MAKQLFGQAGSFLSGGDTAILARGRIEPLFVDRGSHFVGAAVFFADGRELTCFSLRLAPPPSRLDFWSLGFWQEHRDLRKLHRRQLSQFIALARDTPSSPSLVVGGDFNTTPLDRALDELRPLLGDAYDRAGIGWGATGTNDWPIFRVDQVWCNSRLIPLRSFAETTSFSDHRMVVCDVEVPE
jgi:endonuclease/exonuclease/phosphatase (EEP) superfamily protein YafD